jgi:hypothetical protein
VPVPTVSSIAHLHSTDVDTKQKFNAKIFDQSLGVCVARAVKALDLALGSHTEFHRKNIVPLLESMKATHWTIKKVLGFGKDDPQSVDALALARLPVEGLYGLCLMFEDARWIDIYLRDDWRKQYRLFLLQREETKNLPRFDEFNQKDGPTNVEGLRTLLGITEAQRATIELRELGIAMPRGMKIEEIPRFPTPGKALTHVPAGGRRRMLERMYPEYERLCSFAHGMPTANLFKAMFNKYSQYQAFHSPDVLADTFHREVAERSYLLSLISIVQATAELTTLYPANIDLKAAVVEAWKHIAEGTMLGQTIWSIRTKDLLGAIA